MSGQTARILGAQNRSQGETLEEQIATACMVYRRRGVAAIEKTPEPMKVIQRLDNGRFVACFSKKAQPDFQGTLRTGRSVMFEAKTTRTGKILQSVVTKEQTEYLDSHAAMGALCFVVVSFGGFYARVPWQDWTRMKELYGHKYMTSEEAQPYRIRHDKYGALAFLG